MLKNEDIFLKLKQGGLSPGNQGIQGKVRDEVREKLEKFMKNCQQSVKIRGKIVLQLS